MPFDYNSFLQGVQTGLRLGRTSPGRVPPMPPVPGGRYILTENGVPVITEKIVFSEVDLVILNVWYETKEPYIFRDVLYQQAMYEAVNFDGNNVPAQIFCAQRENQYYGLILAVQDYSRVEPPRVALFTRRKNNDGFEIDVTVRSFSVYGPTSNGFWYAMRWVANLVPTNIRCLDLTYTLDTANAIREYLEGLGPCPLITEGD